MRACLRPTLRLRKEPCTFSRPDSRHAAARELLAAVGIILGQIVDFSAKELARRASFSLSAQFGVCLFSSGIPVRPPVRQTNEGDTNTFAWHGAMLSAQSFVHEFISSFKRTKLLSLSGPSGKENSSVRDAIRILTPSWSITRENG